MSSNRPVHRQPTPQQETLGDRLSQFGSSSIGRVDHRSAYDWKGRANRVGSRSCGWQLALQLLIDRIADSQRRPEPVEADLIAP